MVFTAYIVLSSTTIFTPQETHITDMQLEQLGHDSLVVMATPRENGIPSTLYQSINNDQPTVFTSNFTRLLNSKVSSGNDTLHYNVTVYYRNDDQILPFAFADDGHGYYRENAVKVTQWLRTGDDAIRMELRDKIILVEVLIWRG